MRYSLSIAAILIASVSLASTFTGSAAAPKGLVTSPISQRINAVVVPAENAFRRNPQATADDSIAAKAEIEAAIAKVVGQRTNLTMRIDSLTTRDGKTIAAGRINVSGKLMWDADSQVRVEARRRDWEEAATTKLQPPIIQTEVERLHERIELARLAYVQAQKAANDRAAARIPDATVEIEFDELPPVVRQGMKASLMGWIRSITVSPEVKSGIAYASVKMTIVYQGPVNAAFAATRPSAAQTTQPAITSPATQSAPATQPVD